MYLAKVTGTVVATTKCEGMEGLTLLVVEATDDEGKPVGKPAVAVDAAQAGVGEFVYVVTGREATLALDDSFVPVDLAVIGHIDDVNVMASAMEMKAGETEHQGEPVARAAKPKPRPRRR
jgi:ethanolamine utilization protein EutN